jgi:hypothetical protein
MGDDDTSTKKYHQIVVPDHALKPDTSGTSFLRMGTFPSLTDSTQQPPGFRKSHKLAELAGEHHLKTGGSWHHVDGNRVETTTGRKVEVIAGSYVAHRGPGNSPGVNFSATWASNSYTQVGSRDVPIGWDPNNSPATAPSPTPVYPPDNFVETLSFTYDGSRMGDDPLSHIETTPPDLSTNNALTDGDVVAVTWAQRVLTYVGSTGRPVPVVYAETHVGSIQSKTFSHTGDITTWNHADSAGGTVWTDTLASAAIVTTSEAPTITVTNTGVNLLTNNVGFQEVLNLGPAVATATAAGAVTTLTLAGAVATLTAAGAVATVTQALVISNINVGKQIVVNMPSRSQFTLDEEGLHNTKTDATNAETRLANIESRIRVSETAISETNTHLDQTDTRVGGIQAYLGAMLLHGM